MRGGWTVGLKNGLSVGRLARSLWLGKRRSDSLRVWQKGDLFCPDFFSRIRVKGENFRGGFHLIGES
jgi:hypothetical protein